MDLYPIDILRDLTLSQRFHTKKFRMESLMAKLTLCISEAEYMAVSGMAAHRDGRPQGWLPAGMAAHRRQLVAVFYSLGHPLLYASVS
jgi:hypothetical protein